MAEHIEIDGVHLLGWSGIGKRREDFDAFLSKVNGCGAGNAKFDFVPDTIWGLNVTPVCNLHDDSWVFCPDSREAFDESNEVFRTNLIKWVRAKSNFVTVWPRLVRVNTYYNAVRRFGWPAFRACKDALKVMV